MTDSGGQTTDKTKSRKLDRRNTGVSVVLFSVLCLLFSVASGCGTQDDRVGGSSPSVGSKKIVVWHWMTDRDSAFNELAKRYEEETGIKVEFDLFAPSDAYSQKVRAAAQGTNLPDVFGILGEKRDFASFIKAGHVLNLAPFYEETEGEWKNRISDKALAVNEFADGNFYGVDRGIYGVPIDMTAIAMFYNKDLFKELGLDPDRPPATFSEFIEIGRKIKARNIQGLVTGGSEGWLLGCLANNYAFNLMGQDKVLATIRGEVPYSDPGWISVLDLFKEMRQAGLLANEVVTMTNKTAEQLFANQKAVFAFNGSWGVNVYQSMNPDLDYGVMYPPSAAKEHPMAIWKGAGSSFMVNSRSRNRMEAVKFLQWLTECDQQSYLSGATSNLPANKECLGTLSSVLMQLAAEEGFSTHPNTWGVTEFPLVIETWNRGIQSIILGEKTPEQVAQEVQRVKERQESTKRHEM